MRIMAVGVAAAMLLAGCASDGYYEHPPRDWRSYDHNRPDPSYGGYDASRYHRDRLDYRERRLGPNDRIYRGNDGRYYCRRDDGTTGLIIGAIAGGVLGNVIAPGRSERLATILGMLAGGLIGHEIDRDNIRCR